MSQTFNLEDTRRRSTLQVMALTAYDPKPTDGTMQIVNVARTARHYRRFPELGALFVVGNNATAGGTNNEYDNVRRVIEAASIAQGAHPNMHFALGLSGAPGDMVAHAKAAQAQLGDCSFLLLPPDGPYRDEEGQVVEERVGEFLTDTKAPTWFYFKDGYLTKEGLERLFAKYSNLIGVKIAAGQAKDWKDFVAKYRARAIFVEGRAERFALEAIMEGDFDGFTSGLANVVLRFCLDIAAALSQKEVDRAVEMLKLAIEVEKTRQWRNTALNAGVLIKAMNDFGVPAENGGLAFGALKTMLEVDAASAEKIDPLWTPILAIERQLAGAEDWRP